MFRYSLILAIFTFIFFGSSIAYGAEAESDDNTIQLTWGSFDPLASDPEIASDWAQDGRAATSTSYRLVQFERPLTAADRDSLQGMGVSLIAYVPQLTYIVHTADPVSADLLNTLDWVRWVGDYAPAFRVEPTVVEAYDTAKTSRQASTAILIVTLFPQASVDAVSADFVALGATVLGSITDESQSSLQIEADLQLLPQLAAVDGVNWIDFQPDAQTQNMVATEITGVNAVRNTTTVPGLFGAGQVIAVADTGLDLGINDPSQLHDDFEDGAGNSRVISLIDNANDGAEDNTGHGTHVAGTVLGNGARSGSDPLNNNFANSQAGVAPQASLIMQAIGSDSGALSGIPWYLPWMFLEASTPVDGQSAKIHSNSWGIPNSNGIYSGYSKDIDTYMWNNPEFLIVFAAGNEGHNGAQSIMAPATAKNALSVGATDNSVESPHILSNYSGRGPTRDGRIKPDLVAPGTGILSTASAQKFDTDYIPYFGTSMATPHVSGAAALIREYLANNGHATPSSALVKGMLINGTHDLALDPTSNVTVTRPTNEAGWGLLDVANSVGVTGGRSVQYWDSLATNPANQSTALNTGDVATHAITVHNSSQPLNITLAWTDYPGTTAANGALVNDLDLHLVAPDGTIIYPNHANSGTVGDNYDHVNNVVGIDIDAPQLGAYEIVVRGYNVAMSSQPYALIVSGGLEEDPNICEQPIDGPGLYNLCDIGVALDVTEAVDITAVRVEVINTPANTLIDPSLMLDRYYRVTTVSDNPAAVLSANAIFNYAGDNRRDLNNIIASSLSAHQFIEDSWQIHAPDALDQANSTLTVEAVALTGSSDWGFATSTPTAVTLSSLSASGNASDLAMNLSADFLANILSATDSDVALALADSLTATESDNAFSFANNLTENLTATESDNAFSFANNLTNNLSAATAFLFANFLTVILTPLFGLMMVITAVAVVRK